jgi:hypothetical protein
MAKFKVGDKVKVKYPGFGYQNGIVTGIVDEPGIKKAYEIDFTNGERYTVAADAVFAANSVRSSNSVVAKALNSKVAMNADAGFEELKWSLLTDIAQAENTAVKEIRKVLSKLSDKLDALKKQYMSKVKDPGQKGDIYRLCYLDAKEILDKAWY